MHLVIVNDRSIIKGMSNKTLDKLALIDGKIERSLQVLDAGPWDLETQKSIKSYVRSLIEQYNEILDAWLLSENCDCEDCEDDPCSMNCDRDDECKGCREAREENEEARFEADCAQGRI